MTESLSQSSVVHITSLWGVSPLVQFNGQLGDYGQLTVSTDVPMAWHMGIHAHAHTLSPGIIHFWGDNVYISQSMAKCLTLVSLHVCRHGNMYVLHSMLTGMVCLIEPQWAQNFWLMCFLHINTAQVEVRPRAVREYPLRCIPVCKVGNPRAYLTAWAITNIQWASSWSGLTSHWEELIFSPVDYLYQTHYKLVLISFVAIEFQHKMKKKNLNE